MSNSEELSTADVITLGQIVDAAGQKTNVRFVPEFGAEASCGVARCLVGDAGDIRDRSLRINDGISDIDIPVRDILAAAQIGGFDPGLNR